MQKICARGHLGQKFQYMACGGLLILLVKILILPFGHKDQNPESGQEPTGEAVCGFWVGGCSTATLTQED